MNFAAAMMDVARSRWLVWPSLALPALPLVARLIDGEGYTPELLYISGIWSVRFMALTLSITPLLRLAPKGWPQRIIALARHHRRALGVASFGYALLHTIFYMLDTGALDLIWLEALELRLALGWLAFIALIAGAATSNRIGQMALGSNWKPIQRIAYLAAALTALHWWWIGQFMSELWFWTALLLALRAAAFAYQLSSSSGNWRR